MGLFSSPKRQLTKVEIQVAQKIEELKDLQSNIQAKESQLNAKLNALKSAETRTEKAKLEQEAYHKELDKLDEQRQILKAEVTHNQEIRDALEKDINKQISGLKQRENAFEKRMFELKRIELAQAEQEKLLTTKAKLLQTKAAELKSREKDTVLQERSAEKKKRKVHKQIEYLEQDLLKLNIKREETIAHVSTLRHSVDHLKAETKDREKFVKLVNEKERVLEELIEDIKLKQASLKGQLNEEKSLTKHISALDREHGQLSAEITVLEEKRLQTQNDIADMKSAIVAMEKEIEEHKKLLRQKGKWKKEFDAERQELAELQALLDKKNALLADKENELNASMADLDTAKEHVAKKDVENAQRLAALLKREEGISQRESLIEIKEKDLANYSKEMKLLEKEKEEIFALRDEVEDDIRKLTAQDKVLTKKEKTLDKDYSERSRLLKIAYNTKEKELEKKQKELLGREKLLAQDKLKWHKREDEIKEAIDYMKKEKEIIDEDSQLSRRQYEAIVTEYGKKKVIIDKNIQFIKDESKRLKKLQIQDMKLLKEKEKQVGKKIKELQKERKMLDQTESKAGKKVLKIRSKEKELALREKEVQRKSLELLNERKYLEALKRDIDRYDQIKKEIPQLARKHKELQNTVGKIQAELIGISVDAIQEKEAADKKEKKLKQKEERLMQAQKKLIKREKFLVKEEGRFVVEAQPALKAALEMPQPLPMPSEDECTEKGMKGVLEDARIALESSDIEQAIRLLAMAEVLLDKMTEEEQRTVVYDIRELKTSIKLASLG
ncbi:MAG: hypothetical protein ACE5FT_01605 [Candidatus Nanoarchaeia archaeon]